MFEFGIFIYARAQSQKMLTFHCSECVDMTWTSSI
jgi:hypothetical protein